MKGKKQDIEVFKRLLREEKAKIKARANNNKSTK